MSDLLATLPTFPFDTPPGLDTDPAALRLLATASVARALLDGQELWLTLGYHATRQSMTDPRLSREPITQPGCPVTLPSVVGQTDVISVMDPPRHTRVRRLLAAAFTARMVTRLRPRIQQIIDQRLDALAAHDQPADLMSVFFAPLPIIVICELLGVPESDRSELRGFADTFSSAAPDPAILAAAHQAMGEFLGALIADKREHPGEDLTTALVNAREGDDRLTDAELVINLQTLLFAGHDTTLSQLSNGVVALSRHPDQFALLRANPDLADNAVEELLRYDKLVSSTMPRIAAEDLDLDGYRIRAGEAVIGLPHIANRDPAVFTDPNRLDVNRANAAQHISFTHGPHFCIGAPLARAELTMALAALVRRFPALDLAVPDSELAWRQQSVTRAPLALPVSW